MFDRKNGFKCNECGMQFDACVESRINFKVVYLLKLVYLDRNGIGETNFMYYKLFWQ